MTLPLFPSAWMTEEHRALQDVARRYINDKWVPRAAEFREGGRMDATVWRDAAANGLLCVSTPEQYGGGGVTSATRPSSCWSRPTPTSRAWGGGLHAAIVAPYILHYGTEPQKRRWLPKMCTAEGITAIAMTEPGTGRACRPCAPRRGATVTAM